MKGREIGRGEKRGKKSKRVLTAEGKNREKNSFPSHKKMG